MRVGMMRHQYLLVPSCKTPSPILDDAVEPGPFVRGEIQTFTPETTGSGPPDDGLGNLDRGLVIGGAYLSLKSRTRLHFDETANAAASNRQVAQSSFARDNVC